jgi:hypothetical protein
MTSVAAGGVRETEPLVCVVSETLPCLGKRLVTVSARISS